MSVPFTRRRWLQYALTCLSLSPFTLALAAVAGRDYQVLSDTPSDGKNVEVLEIFSYGCPHCAHLAPLIEPWSHKLPAGVVYRRIPVTFGHAQWAVLARTYYVLEQMREVNRLQEKIFSAIHEQNINLFSEDTLFDWIARQGVNRPHFIELYHSFAIQTKVQQGDQQAMNYGVDGVPTVIIDGRYSTSPTLAGSNQALFPILNQLIEQELRIKRTGR